MTIETSSSLKGILPALLRFQGAVDGVRRDSANPHFRSRYASLENVIDTARPHLQDNGLVLTQAPGRVVEGCIEVTTRISHAESGEWIQATVHMPLAKKDPQGAGSALTYGQRYSLMAALGLPPTDDDAEMAMDRRPSQDPRGARAPAAANARKPADQNTVIADTMIAAINSARSRKDLNAWEEGQREKIADLDPVNRRRVDEAGEQRYHELPEAA